MIEVEANVNKKIVQYINNSNNKPRNRQTHIYYFIVPHKQQQLSDLCSVNKGDWIRSEI